MYLSLTDTCTDRQEIKRRSDGIGEHFNDHAIQLGLDLKKSSDMDELLTSFKLTIVGSVQSGKPWTQDMAGRPGGWPTT